MPWRFSPFSGRDTPRDLRVEMIDQTQAFLNWALAEERELPRIPRRAVHKGGFTGLLSDPGVREMVGAWWNRILGSNDLEA